MRYDSLLSCLTRLESLIGVAPSTSALSAYIRCAPHAPIQGYALDQFTRDQSLPVIVALGVNYTQGQTRCPRCPSPPGAVAVEDDLSACRRHLNKALQAHAKVPGWRSCGKSNVTAQALGLSKEWGYHLVMSNFCLWNTTKRWLEIPKANRSYLLASNPPFGGRPTTAPSWPHLQELAQALAPAPLVWVVHGLHSGVFDLFEHMGATFPPAKWIMTPNLGFPYYRYGTCYPRP